MLFSKAQLEYVVRQYVDYYNTERPHQGLENTVPLAPKEGFGCGEVICKERLGGLLKSYEREVA